MVRRENHPTCSQGEELEKTGKLQRERGKGSYRSKRKVENLKRYFEVVRETVIHVENFPVD